MTRTIYTTNGTYGSVKLSTGEVVNAVPTNGYILTKDNDGHSYMIPLELINEFHSLLEVDEHWLLDEWEKYNDMQIESPEAILIESYTKMY